MKPLKPESRKSKAAQSSGASVCLPSKPDSVGAFSLIELMVVMVLLSLIVLALMAVFDATQTAFRSSVTQADVSETGRATINLIRNDLVEMTPSLDYSNRSVNFYVGVQVTTNAPLIQPLVGVIGNVRRTNVLENLFILTRDNQTWTGIGYVVNASSSSPINPLYRFSMSTNVEASSPFALYTNFVNEVADGDYTNMSHLMDGVVGLTVHAYDPNGVCINNYYGYYTNAQNTCYLTVGNGSGYGEEGFCMYSNTLPASVEIELDAFEDRTLQRAESFGAYQARTNYLAQQVGKVHVFRQRVLIRNCDPAAYQ
jgi:hypothetical protein